MSLLQVVSICFQEEVTVSVWIEDRALSAANPLCDKRLGEDGIAELNFPGLWKYRAILCDDA